MTRMDAAHAVPRLSRRLTWWSLAAVALGLTAACAPAAAEEPARVAVQQLVAAPSFYPQETGTRWSYLRDGARLDDPRYVETIEGPAVLEGDVWIAFRLVGGGQDATHYRQFRPDGVYLRRQLRPGGSFTFEPPMRELPAPTELRVGAIWSGSSVVKGNFPGASVGQRVFEQAIDYVFTVVDQRPVTVGGRVYDVFVIDRTTRSFDAEGTVVEEYSQQIWFAPGVGKVRHENGWFLIDANFEAGRPAP
jgi:hypothetical protein